MKNIVILGSTGSIGCSTLNIVAQHPDRFRVIALTADRNHELLFQQCQQFSPDYAVINDPTAAKILNEQLTLAHSTTQLLCGAEHLEKIVALPEVEAVMAGIVGASGLLSTLAAARAGKQILLANKESLVMAGELLIKTAQQHHALLLPIDSEHNAIFQCLPPTFKTGITPPDVKRLLITASGGAFRDRSLSELQTVTPAQACTHPNWTMGRKITVDSATMMNKGLEIIEAHWLFGLPAEKIDTVLHPQSIVHSFVEFIDGSMLAQLGNPDMRIPISYALGWPERITNNASSLDLLALGRLDFLPMDFKRYPCLALAYQVLKAGGTAPTILNAANEIAVQAFLSEKIAFTDIPVLVDHALQKIPSQPAHDLETILDADRQAREVAMGFTKTAA